MDDEGMTNFQNGIIIFLKGISEEMAIIQRMENGLFKYLI